MRALPVDSLLFQTLAWTQTRTASPRGVAQDECARPGCAQKPGGPAAHDGAYRMRVVFTFPEFVYVIDYLAFLGEYFFQLRRFDHDPILNEYDLSEYLETVNYSDTNVAIDSESEFEDSDAELDQAHLTQLEILLRNQELDITEGN